MNRKALINVIGRVYLTGIITSGRASGQNEQKSAIHLAISGRLNRLAFQARNQPYGERSAELEIIVGMSVLVVSLGVLDNFVQFVPDIVASESIVVNINVTSFIVDSAAIAGLTGVKGIIRHTSFLLSLKVQKQVYAFIIAYF